ncbi:MAG: cytochrome C biogenesis protein [Calditrichaeota bacterium]|nr:MAG: cytochrome C biogenesis protein [Calditrichota bacterium]
MWWKSALFILMSVMIVYSFTTPAPQKMIGESSRIFYYHIPQAWICVIAFAMSMIYSIKYLKTKDIHEDDKALVAAKLGFVFCLLATLSGATFAKVTWGSFWNWDPRETSIFILLLIYGAYFALRGAVDVEEKRASLSAVYSIFAFITVPFLIFIVPRLVPSLHPEDSIIDENMKFTMSPMVRTIFFSSLGLFTIFYFWLFNIGKRVQLMARNQVEQEDF